MNKNKNIILSINRLNSCVSSIFRNSRAILTGGTKTTNPFLLVLFFCLSFNFEINFPQTETLFIDMISSHNEYCCIIWSWSMLGNSFKGRLSCNATPFEMKKAYCPNICQNIGRLILSSNNDQTAFIGDQIHRMILPSTWPLAKGLKILKLFNFLFLKVSPRAHSKYFKSVIHFALGILPPE